MIVEFSRRKFLLAAGGSALALPVLEALTPRSAHAAFDTVKRMVFFVTVNGSPRGNRPTGVGPSFELGPIFSGLERHKADTLFITGLGSRAAEISNGDPHALGFATTLSGCKALPGDLFRHGACFDQPTCQGTGWGGGPSVDQLIAQAHIAAGVPIIESSLNFAVKNAPGSLYTRLSYSAPGTPLTPEASPSDAFDRIFGGVKSTDPAVLARIRARQASVLDELDAELVSLQTRLSAADRLRLDAHLTGLRSLEAKIARMEGQSGGECGPPTRSPLGAGTLVKRNDGGMEEDVQEHMMDSIIERHRHRFEVSNDFRTQIEEKGLLVSGRYTHKETGLDLVEMVEIPEHPWFLGCQFHPEFLSKPLVPHPLFSAFIKAAKEASKGAQRNLPGMKLQGGSELESGVRGVKA